MARSMQPAEFDIEHSAEGIKIESASEPEKAAREIRGVKWFIFVSAVLSTTFLFGLDNTLVADIQPSIIQRLGEISKLPWVGTSFALGAVATILPWGRAYGVFDVKWLYVTHVFLFEIGSALCGAAPTMNALIIGRAIAGLGGSGMYVGCLNYLSLTTTVEERPMYMGLIALSWGIGTVLGPVVGGAFADSSATWRWAFYINLVIGAIFAPAYIFLLPSIDLHPGVSLMQKITKQTDWLGIIGFAGAMCTFVMAVSFGGSVYAWSSTSEIILWVMTGVLFIAFGFTQRFYPLVSKEHKLYPTHFLKNPTLVVLQVFMVCAAVSLFVPVYYIPLYFQFAQGDSALKAAVRLLPFIIVLVIFSLANGVLMPKWGYYMPWFVFGGAIVLAGATLMCKLSYWAGIGIGADVREDTVTSNTSASSVYGYSILLGVGTGSFLQAGFSIAQALVAPEEIANAVGFMSVGQSFGIVLGLGVSGAVYQTKAIAYVLPIFPGRSSSDVRDTIAGTSSAVFVALSESTRFLVVDAIIKAIDKVYIVVIATSALTIVLACFLPRTKLFIALQD